MVRLLSKIWCCSVNVTGILGEKELQVLLLRVQPYLRVNMWTRNHIVAACRMFVTVGPIKQSSLPHKSSIAQQYEIWSTNHKVKSLSPIGSIWSFFFSEHAWVIHSITTLIFHPVAEFTSPFSLTALHWKRFRNMANLKKLAKCAFDFAAMLHSPAEAPFFPLCKLCLFDSSSTVPRHDHKCLFSNRGVRWEEIPKF